MSKRRDADYLADILEASRRAQAYFLGMDYDAFLADTKTQDAVIRTLDSVWHVVTSDLPTLETEVESILSKLAR